MGYLWMSMVVCGLIADSGSNISEAKSDFNLFHPTPQDLLRPLSADRPDGTESPYTVDAGHIQVELSFFEYARDGSEEDWSVLNTNLKIGLTHNSDLQFVFDAYGREDRTATGFGDVQMRLKVNLWGNDAGQTSFGVMPWIKIPTNTRRSNGRVEGGLIAMFAWNAGENWSLGFMAEFDAVYNDADYDLEFVHTAVLGVDLLGPLGGYLEYIGIAGTDGDYQAIVSSGLTYALRADLVLDLGTRLGLTDVAEDMAAFAGFTWRY